MNGTAIQDTPIAVDIWTRRVCLKSRLFFLSHAHADHTQGLTSSWTKYKIYCSEITKRILMHKLNVNEDLLVALPLGEPVVLPLDEEGREMLTVTLLDANHCPGAVMFLFEGYFGTILYTGDFRFKPAMLLHESLKGKQIDKLYLDNTYCHPSCNFPTKTKTMKLIFDIIRRRLGDDIIIPLRTLGKEDLLVKIALEFNCWIGVTPKKMELLKWLDLPDVFTSEWHKTQIIVAQHPVNSYTLSQFRDPFVILPTALYEGEKSNPYRHLPNYVTVPYSDHSSFKELLRFVSGIAPAEVIPLVSSCYTDMEVFESFLSPRLLPVPVVPDTVKKFMKIDILSMNSKKSRARQKPRQLKRKRMGVVFDDEVDDSTDNDSRIGARRGIDQSIIPVNINVVIEVSIGKRGAVTEDGRISSDKLIQTSKVSPSEPAHKRLKSMSGEYISTKKYSNTISQQTALHSIVPGNLLEEVNSFESSPPCINGEPGEFEYSTKNKPSTSDMRRKPLGGTLPTSKQMKLTSSESPDDEPFNDLDVTMLDYISDAGKETTVQNDSSEGRNPLREVDPNNPNNLSEIESPVYEDLTKGQNLSGVDPKQTSNISEIESAVHNESSESKNFLREDPKQTSNISEIESAVHNELSEGQNVLSLDPKQTTHISEIESAVHNESSEGQKVLSLDPKQTSNISEIESVVHNKLSEGPQRVVMISRCHQEGPTLTTQAEDVVSDSDSESVDHSTDMNYFLVPDIRVYSNKGLVTPGKQTLEQDSELCTNNDVESSGSSLGQPNSPLPGQTEKYFPPMAKDSLNQPEVHSSSTGQPGSGLVRQSMAQSKIDKRHCTSQIRNSKRVCRASYQRIVKLDHSYLKLSKTVCCACTPAAGGRAPSKPKADVIKQISLHGSDVHARTTIQNTNFVKETSFSSEVPCQVAEYATVATCASNRQRKSGTVLSMLNLRVVLDSLDSRKYKRLASVSGLAKPASKQPNLYKRQSNEEEGHCFERTENGTTTRQASPGLLAGNERHQDGGHRDKRNHETYGNNDTECDANSSLVSINIEHPDSDTLSALQDVDNSDTASNTENFDQHRDSSFSSATVRNESVNDDYHTKESASRHLKDYVAVDKPMDVESQQRQPMVSPGVTVKQEPEDRGYTGGSISPGHPTGGYQPSDYVDKPGQVDCHCHQQMSPDAFAVKQEPEDDDCMAGSRLGHLSNESSSGIEFGDIHRSKSIKPFEVTGKKEPNLNLGGSSTPVKRPSSDSINSRKSYNHSQVMMPSDSVVKKEPENDLSLGEATRSDEHVMSRSVTCPHQHLSSVTVKKEPQDADLNTDVSTLSGHFPNEPRSPGYANAIMESVSQSNKRRNEDRPVRNNRASLFAECSNSNREPGSDSDSNSDLDSDSDSDLDSDSSNEYDSTSSSMDFTSTSDTSSEISSSVESTKCHGKQCEKRSHLNYGNLHLRVVLRPLEMCGYDKRALIAKMPNVKVRSVNTRVQCLHENGKSDKERARLTVDDEQIFQGKGDGLMDSQIQMDEHHECIYDQIKVRQIYEQRQFGRLDNQKEARKTTSRNDQSPVQTSTFSAFENMDAVINSPYKANSNSDFTDSESDTISYTVYSESEWGLASNPQTLGMPSSSLNQTQHGRKVDKLTENEQKICDQQVKSLVNERIEAEMIDKLNDGKQVEKMHKGDRQMDENKVRQLERPMGKGQLDDQKEDQKTDKRELAERMDEQKDAGQISEQKESKQIDQQKEAGHTDEHKEAGQINKQKEAGQINEQKETGQMNRQKVTGQMLQRNKTSQKQRRNKARPICSLNYSPTKTIHLQSRSKRQRRLTDNRFDWFACDQALETDERFEETLAFINNL